MSSPEKHSKDYVAAHITLIRIFFALMYPQHYGHVCWIILHIECGTWCDADVYTSTSHQLGLVSTLFYLVIIYSPVNAVPCTFLLIRSWEKRQLLSRLCYNVFLKKLPLANRHSVILRLSIHIFPAFEGDIDLFKLKQKS